MKDSPIGRRHDRSRHYFTYIGGLTSRRRSTLAAFGIDLVDKGLIHKGDALFFSLGDDAF